MRRRLSIVIMSLLFVIGFSVCSFAEMEYDVYWPKNLWAGDFGDPVLVFYEDSDDEDIFGEAEVESVESSNPDVIEIGEFSSTTDYGLYPKKAGSSVITVFYKTESGIESESKEVKVKKYPNHIKSLKVNGKKVNVSKNKYAYRIYNYKGTKLNVKVTPKKGWKIVDASYDLTDKNLKSKYVYSGVKTKIQKGSTIKVAKKYKYIFVNFTMKNTKGEEINYMIAIRR